jgi:D-glycero-alpha-D-manno-heptose-7-phosphate kinase
MIITQTPLRISFVGGGTDLPKFYKQHGGAVISSGIDKYVFSIVKERFDQDIYLNYMKKEIVSSVSEIQHELMREAMKKAGVKSSVEITTLSDIPASGSGLGSSSSVTVALLQSLYLHAGIIVDAERLAREACEIEIDILGGPIGKQDQYIAAYGGLNLFEFNKDGSVTVIPIKIDEHKYNYLNSCLLLYFTGKTRSANTILAEQNSKIADTANILQKMRDQATKVKNELEKENIDYIGEALAEGWELKKQLAGGVSNLDIDKMYEKALKAGAIGGKIAGAGGGGFLLLYAPLKNHENIRRALSNYREMPFNLSKDGSKSIFNIRR